MDMQDVHAFTVTWGERSFFSYPSDAPESYQKNENCRQKSRTVGLIPNAVIELFFVEINFKSVFIN